MTDIEQLRKDVETQSVGPYQDYLALAKAYIEQAADIERLREAKCNTVEQMRLANTLCALAVSRWPWGKPIRLALYR